MHAFLQHSLELVSKELNHLAAILHMYLNLCQGFDFDEVENILLFLKKKRK